MSLPTLLLGMGPVGSDNNNRNPLVRGRESGIPDFTQRSASSKLRTKSRYAHSFIPDLTV